MDRPQGYPQPQPAPPVSFAQYLVSLWHGQLRDAGGINWDVYVSFKPDGSFFQQQSMQNGQFVITLVGHYRPQLTANGGSIAFELLQWDPRQICNNVGCQPLNFPRFDTVPVQLLGHDSYQTPFGQFQRVGPPR